MIKFLDLKEINASFEPELSAAARRVIDSGWYLMGNEVKAFKEEYSVYIGTQHCIGIANGLDALRLILKAYIENAWHLVAFWQSTYCQNPGPTLQVFPFYCCQLLSPTKNWTNGLG